MSNEKDDKKKQEQQKQAEKIAKTFEELKRSKDNGGYR